MVFVFIEDAVSLESISQFNNFFLVLFLRKMVDIASERCQTVVEVEVVGDDDEAGVGVTNRLKTLRYRTSAL